MPEGTRPKDLVYESQDCRGCHTRVIPTAVRTGVRRLNGTTIVDRYVGACTGCGWRFYSAQRYGLPRRQPSNAT